MIIILKDLDAMRSIDSTNLLDFVREVTATWLVDVKQETIAKCFAKAGFSQVSDWDDEDNLPLAEWIVRESEDSEEICSLWQAWKETCDFNDVSDVIDYINIDAEVCTHEILNDDEILSLLLKNDSDEELSDDDAANSVEKPSIKEVNYSISVLQRAVETSAHINEEAHLLIAKLHKCFEKGFEEKQQKITHYFGIT